MWGLSTHDRPQLRPSGCLFNRFNLALVDQVRTRELGSGGFRISPQASRKRGGPSLFVGSWGRSHQEAVCVVFDGKVMKYTRPDIVMLSVTTMAVAFLLYVLFGPMN